MIKIREESVVFRYPEVVYVQLMEMQRRYKLSKSVIVRKAINKYIAMCNAGRTVPLRKRKIKCTRRMSFRERSRTVEILQEKHGDISPVIWRILDWYFKIHKTKAKDGSQ